MKLTLAMEVREINLDGIDYYLVERRALAAILGAPAEPEPELPFRFKKRPYTLKAAKKKAGKIPPPSKGAAKPVREGTVMEAVLNVITSAPGRTPSQIFEWASKKVSTTSASCYQTIKYLEKKGLVEPRENEARGGVMGWYPKAA